MNLSIQLKIVGASLLLLALGHASFPGRFNWGEELSRLSPVNRQIFQVHCFFIGLILFMFGALALCFTPLLLDRTPLARIVLSGLVLFWAARLWVQFFIYESSLWKGNRFNTRIHWLFTLMWVYYVSIFGWALWNQLRPV
jgi:uncharacterized membrane protein